MLRRDIVDQIDWNNKSCNDGDIRRQRTKSVRTSFHTKCFHSCEETTKIMTSDDVPWVFLVCFRGRCGLYHNQLLGKASLRIRLPTDRSQCSPHGTRSIIYFLCLPLSPLFGWDILHLIRDLLKKDDFPASNAHARRYVGQGWNQKIVLYPKQQ